ncbi:GAP family protein [Mycolicibacterium sp. 018/SC-01/001]|uniref:GAP family protein n=1 Tax=Mycolicibacterium sp. 018/SC-01/001 TaxID=2592069 RepID=UPI0011808865|nr:GAP family protein [Mycolicibacterium sp. 018/SC-01/001]TRW87919.1 GAP family protein [Mycolicibacterium sp. 018/SC-01/001]
MWIPLLLMAFAVSLEPFRIGMTVVMVNRPRPALQLLAFLTGGFCMGIAVGVVVLFVLRPALDSARFTLPVVQIVVGAIVLANAVLIALGVFGRGPSTDGAVVGQVRRLLGGRSLWIAGGAGLGIALPSVDYLAALALIVASGAETSVQLGALIMFNVVAFTLVEVPLLAYLVAPDRTRAALTSVHDRIRAGGRRAVAALVAAVGGILVVAGLAGL